MKYWFVDLGYLCAAFVLSRVYFYFLSKKNAGDFVTANILSFFSVFVVAVLIYRDDSWGGAVFVALLQASISQVPVLFWDMYKKAKI